MKNILMLVLAFLGSIGAIMITIISMGLFDLQWSKFYQPKKENIRREVFENTQSYVHGKSQDLAKYFEEYQKSTPEGKEALRQIILMNFADFDANTLRSFQLQQFLNEMRGY